MITATPISDVAIPNACRRVTPTLSSSSEITGTITGSVAMIRAALVAVVERSDA